MKAVILTLALASLASAGTVDAQILGNRIPTTSRSTRVDGSWRAVGRDRNGNTIYERRTYDGNGNIIVQRARRDGNGNLSIISSQTVSNTNDRNGHRNGNNCDNRTTGTISDVIFGRSGNTYCDDNGNRNDSGWYQVGRDNNGNTIYERRTTDSNGNVIVQRARRDGNGNLSIYSTRRVSNDNDGTWDRNGRRDGDDDDDDEDDDDNRWNKDQRNRDKEWEKDQRKRDRDGNRSHRGQGNDRDRDDD